jgi:hypothetical protein
MAGELVAAVREMFDGLDTGDADLALGRAGDDMQAVDEISRRWLRGGEEVSAYMRGLMGAVQDVHSEIIDPHEATWDETGVLTFWLEQDYTHEGNRQHVSAPSTAVLRRSGGEWKIELFHSIPLSDEDG